MGEERKRTEGEKRKIVFLSLLHYLSTICIEELMNFRPYVCRVKPSLRAVCKNYYFSSSLTTPSAACTVRAACALAS